ncbi:MAG: XdhC family protein [Halieaceae bacterium]|jgi:xanthine dehydrogenase accessory factor|nr:XdhC family protein [Halieaceae bacterium]
MHSLDQQVLERVQAWLRQDRSVWLCTIVATLGSSPRPVGSLFACADSGETAGSLSGGCVEEDLVEKLLAGAVDHAVIQEYGVTAEENERLGLPCGGRLEILVEPLSRSGLPQIDTLLDAVRERQYLTRAVSLPGGEVSLEPATAFAPLSRTEALVRHTLGPRFRLLLIGAGALSETLSQLASAMDYQVMVNDPRPEALQRWQGEAVARIAGMPDDAVRAYADDPHSIVLTLTHDPRIDDMALMQALEQDLFYVGALGSVRTTEKRIQRLRDLGLTEAQLARLHAPVGLPIGSKTPMEIAIAILAELTQLRRRP